MDVREKLVELQSIITCPNAICNFCEHFKNKSACERHKKEVIADNMIAHGVTVLEWMVASIAKRTAKDTEKCLVLFQSQIYSTEVYGISKLAIVNHDKSISAQCADGGCHNRRKENDYEWKRM